MLYAWVAGVALGSEDSAPQAASRQQTSSTWGPYTSGGMGLSERNNERYGLPVGELFLQPHLDAMAVYEDNVYLDSTDKQSELYTVLTPGVMLVYGNPRDNYIYADYSLDFTDLQVTDGSVLDGQALKLGGNWGDAKSRYNVAQEFRDVRDVDVQAGTRLKRQSATTSAGYDNLVSSKTSAGLYGQYMVNRYEDPAYSDYREYNAFGRTSWQMLPKTSLTGRAGHGWVDVEEVRDAYGSAQYDEVTIGLSGRPSPRLETSGEIGVQHRYFEADDIEDITSEVGRLRFGGDPLERLHLWFEASMGLQPAINAPGFTVVNTQLEPGVSRRLFSERVIGSFSVLWGQYDYMGPGTAAEDPYVYDGRQDNYWGYNANIDFWIGRYWSVGLGYSYLENESEAGDSASYDNSRWMLRATFNR